jgi:hypothetical protein
MGLPFDHIPSNLLARVLSGGQDIEEVFWHMRECAKCRRAFATTILIGRLVSKQKGTERPEGGVPVERLDNIEQTTLGVRAGHLSGVDLDWFHAVAFEGQDFDGSRYVELGRHLNTCDSCFARFFSLHEYLSPSPAAVARAVSAFVDSRQERPLGSLSLFLQKSFRRPRFRPAATLDIGEVAFDNALSDALESHKKSSAGRKSPLMDDDSEADAPVMNMSFIREDPFARNSLPSRSLSFDAYVVPDESTIKKVEVQIAGMTAQIGVSFESEQPFLLVRFVVTDGDAPCPGVTIIGVNRGGLKEHAAETDAQGNASIPIGPELEALQIKTLPGETPWILKLEISGREK